MPDETVATPTATPALTPTTTAAAPTPTVTIPADQLAALLALQGKVAQLEAEQRTREQAAAAERVRLLTEKGDAENAVKTLRAQADSELAAERAKLSTTEERAKRYALEGELARALGAQSLVSAAAAAQLAGIFRGEFQVHAEGDSFAVRTPTFQSVPDFVAAQLARPEFAHFVRPGTAGGAGGAGTQTPPPAGDTPVVPEPKTLGEALMRDVAGHRKAAGDPATNMTLPFGLRRKA